MGINYLMTNIKSAILLLCAVLTLVSMSTSYYWHAKYIKVSNALIIANHQNEMQNAAIENLKAESIKYTNQLKVKQKKVEKITIASEAKINRIMNDKVSSECNEAFAYGIANRK